MTAHARRSGVATGTLLSTARFLEEDEAFLHALRSGHRGAAAAFFERHTDHVERVLVRVLGVDAEIPDLVQEVFLRALRGIGDFRGGPDKLSAWTTQIAVFTARGCIRRRQARWWLRSIAPEELPEPQADGASPELAHAAAAALRLLHRLPVDERIAFSLRYLEEMELREIAEACDTSLATIKRRLTRAHGRIQRLAARDAALSPWLQGGDG